MQHWSLLIPVYILVVLSPVIGWGQSLQDKQLMQLVRLYEQSQDSVFAKHQNDKQLIFLQKNQLKSEEIWDNLQKSTDSSIQQVGAYLDMALHIYTYTTQYLFYPDSGSRAQVRALKSLVDQYAPDRFPLRFSVMGNTVVMRYENVAPDLRLYYSNLFPLCSCKETRALIPHLKALGEDALVFEIRKRYKQRCKRKISND
jgi:hypothetical protein